MGCDSGIGGGKLAIADVIERSLGEQGDHEL